MIIVNQKALADVVHDVSLRHHLTAAVETGEHAALRSLAEYLVNSQLATKGDGDLLPAPCTTCGSEEPDES